MMKKPNPLAGETISAAIDPPNWLTLSDDALTEWTPLIQTLAELGTAKHCDLRALALLCEVLASEKRFRDAIAKDGMTIPGADDNLKSNPALRLLESTRNQAHRLLSDFGLIPRGRVMVKAEPATPNDIDPWANFPA